MASRSSEVLATATGKPTSGASTAAATGGGGGGGAGNRTAPATATSTTAGAGLARQSADCFLLMAVGQIESADVSLRFLVDVHTFSLLSRSRPVKSHHLEWQSLLCHCVLQGKGSSRH